jgi:hypothetical protein
MKEIRLINIKYIEQNTEELPFKYKPDVPKLKLHGSIIDMASEEEGEDAILFLTQKQLNQIIGGKDIEIVLSDDDTWHLKHPLKKDQVKQIGLVGIKSEFIGTAGDIKCFEVLEVEA